MSELSMNKEEPSQSIYKQQFTAFNLVLKITMKNIKVISGKLLSFKTCFSSVQNLIVSYKTLLAFALEPLGILTIRKLNFLFLPISNFFLFLLDNNSEFYICEAVQ